VTTSSPDHGDKKNGKGGLPGTKDFGPARLIFQKATHHISTNLGRRGEVGAKLVSRNSSSRKKETRRERNLLQAGREKELLLGQAEAHGHRRARPEGFRVLKKKAKKGGRRHLG